MCIRGFLGPNLTRNSVVLATKLILLVHGSQRQDPNCTPSTIKLGRAQESRKRFSRAWETDKKKIQKRKNPTKPTCGRYIQQMPLVFEHELRNYALLLVLEGQQIVVGSHKLAELAKDIGMWVNVIGNISGRILVR
jgi:hypothetical protein